MNSSGVEVEQEDGLVAGPVRIATWGRGLRHYRWHPDPGPKPTGASGDERLDSGLTGCGATPFQASATMAATRLSMNASLAKGACE